jgi:hypothetical protein
MTGILPWIVVAIVAFIVLRMVIGAIKMSATVLFWLVVIAAAGLAYVWFQQNGGLPSGQ